jgi:hypothetical protein
MAYMNDLQVYINMELYRGQNDLRAMHERDRAEFREILLKLVRDIDTILGTESREDVENIMSSLQTVRACRLCQPLLDMTAGTSRPDPGGQRRRKLSRSIVVTA